MNTKKQVGFTLIELMITVAIVAILAAIALPSYQKYIIRGKRAAAESEMINIANREQQYFLANRAYTSTLSDTGYSLPAEVSANYGCTVTLGTSSVPFYTITCSPTGSQQSDGQLSLTSDGVKTPPEKW